MWPKMCLDIAWRNVRDSYQYPNLVSFFFGEFKVDF
jgi:hypothetical protein